MNRHDVDTAGTKRFQRSLKFIFGYGEIAVYNCVVVTTGKGCPRVDAHRVVDLHSVHGRRSTDGEFYHSVLRFPLHAEDLIQRCGSDRALVRRWAFLDVTLTKCASWFPARTANGFGRVINLLHGCGQFLDTAFTADVHEVNFGLVEKEMVVECRHLEAIVECGGQRIID